MKKFLLAAVSVLVIFAAHSRSANSSGFGIFTQGARELGMLNAVVAHTEGPASNFFNAALLSDLPGTQLEFGTTLIKANREFSSGATGLATDGESDVFYPSTIYLSHQFNENFTGGIGLYSPFGLGTDWPEAWEGRYLGTFSEMRSLSVNPNLAWKISEKFRIGGGIALLWSDAVIERKINLMPFGLTDGVQKFSGDGTAWGYNAGLVYKISRKISLGISYKSRMDMELEGDVSFFVPAGTPPVFNNTSGKVELALPSQVSLGFSYLFSEKFLMEVSARWEGWSRFKSLVFMFDKPPVAGGGSTLTERKSWDDTWTYMIGVKYYYSPALEFSAGFLHGNNPAPDDTFEPSIPAADHDMISIGLNRIWAEKYALALTYLYGWYDDRVKNNAVGGDTGFPANGSYRQNNHMLAASVKIGF